MYIGDWDNGRIRKIDILTGIISTYAGNGIVGYSGDGNLATNAMINRPMALCFDNCGNLIFADNFNNRVRKIDGTTKIITTIAGTGVSGFFGDNGNATNAELNNPSGICVDTFGNLFISEYHNYRVRKVTYDTSCNGMPNKNYVNNVNNTLNINVYPNPVSDAVYVSGINVPTAYTLSNIIGATVLQGIVSAGQAIDVRSLSSGVYVLTLTLSPQYTLSPSQSGNMVREKIKIVKE